MTSELELKEVVKKEYLKCALDPAYTFGRYCNIAHPTQGKIKFKLYDFQKDTLRQFRDNKYNIVLKARQMGISTLVAGYSLWKMMFNNDFKVIVIATNQQAARNLVKKVNLMYDGMPSWAKSPRIENNKLGLSFANGSEIRALSSSPSAARSEAVSLLIVDEAAFIEGFKEVWTSSKMTLATGGDCIILSTPAGRGNQFHSLWVKAEEGEMDEQIEKFNPINLRWDLHPDRDEKWRKQQDVDLGPTQAAQECDCSFLTSGTSVVDGETVEWYKNNMVKEPIEKRGIDQAYWIWKYPDYGKDYIVAADVGRGDAADNSAFVIMEAQSCEIVATYRAKVDTRVFGPILVSAASEYNTAHLVIDNKNIGWDVVQTAVDLNYPNLYYSDGQDPYIDPEIHLKNNSDLKSNSKKIPGFTTTQKVRPVMVSKIEWYFLQKELAVPCVRILNEIDTFIWLNGKAQAMSGANDDLTMCVGEALYVRDTALKISAHGKALSKGALGSIQKTGIVKTGGTNHSSWNVNIKGSQESLKWLLN